VLSTDTEYEKIRRHNRLPNRKEIEVTKALMNMKEKSCKYIIIHYYRRITDENSVLKKVE
jgi:hypothetical protein